MPRWWFALAVTLGLTLACGCDPGDDDDDTIAPDDDDDTTASDDDDSADDDEYDDPCELPAAWIDLLGEPDPEGDAGGYLLDIASYSAALEGTQLVLRLGGHAPFSGFDPMLEIDMYLGDGTTTYTLTWDNQRPNPGPLQLWSDSNDWTEPLASPGSLCGMGDGEAMILGIDLADLGMADAGEVETWAGVDLYSGYLDEAPDGAFEFGLHAVIEVTEEPDLGITAVTFDDSALGDGDGVVDPGETVSVTVQLENSGNGATGADVTGALVAHGAATAAFEVDTPAMVLADGDPLDVGDSTDATFDVSVDAAAVAGQVLRFELSVSDADGNAWTLDTGSTPVGLVQVLSDGVDLAAPFDASAVFYGLDGEDLLVTVVSHSDHEGDQEVDMFLDVDLDGDYDRAVSTIDTESDTFIGGVFVWDGGWVQTSQPTRFEYVSGTDFVLIGVPVVDLGNLVQARAYAVVKDVTEEYSDFVPDDPEETLDLALLEVAEAPFLVLDGSVPAEVAGNGDLYIDAGEQWNVTLSVSNLGTADGAVVTGELTSPVPEITVTDGAVSFGAVAMGTSATGAPVPLLTIDAGAPASASFDLVLAVDADGRTFELPVRVALGILPADLGVEAPVVPAPATLSGDTTDLADDYQNPSACTSYSAIGHDGVYAVELTTGQVLDLDLRYAQGSGVDAVLYVSDDPTSPDLQCLAGADGETGTHEDLSYTATADGTIYVVVDAFVDWGGEFTLEIGF